MHQTASNSLFIRFIMSSWFTWNGLQPIQGQTRKCTSATQTILHRFRPSHGPLAIKPFFFYLRLLLSYKCLLMHHISISVKALTPKLYLTSLIALTSSLMTSKCTIEFKGRYILLSESLLTLYVGIADARYMQYLSKSRITLPQMR